MSIDRCQIFDLPKIHDPRGNLTFIEGGVHVPFDIQRVYYLYDVPGGSERGGHAHERRARWCRGGGGACHPLPCGALHRPGRARRLAHVPVHLGARLPRKASMPSRKSALP